MHDRLGMVMKSLNIYWNSQVHQHVSKAQIYQNILYIVCIPLYFRHHCAPSNDTLSLWTHVDFATHRFVRPDDVFPCLNDRVSTALLRTAIKMFFAPGCEHCQSGIEAGWKSRSVLFQRVE